jgi:hypothetical protein
VLACRSGTTVQLADVLELQVLVFNRNDGSDGERPYQVTLVFRDGQAIVRCLVGIPQELNIVSVRAALAATGLFMTEHGVSQPWLTRDLMRVRGTGGPQDYLERWDQPKLTPPPPKCVKCGYSLAGLGIPEHCPECGVIWPDKHL